MRAIAGQYGNQCTDLHSSFDRTLAVLVTPVAAILLMLISVSPCMAQERDPAGRAVLESGPTPGKGLFFLPVNVIEFYGGEYIADESTITVYFTMTDIATFPSWIDFACDPLEPLIVERDEDGTLIYIGYQDQWSVFARIPNTYEHACRFLEVFINRLRYFLEVGGTQGVPPLPAILELR